MFTQLVESKPATSKGKGSTVLSFVAHYGLVLGVLYTSAEARIVNEGPRPEKIIFTQQNVEELPKQAPPPETVVAPPPVKVPTAVTAPIEIPSTLPDIDLTHPPTDPSQFMGEKRGPAVEEGRGKSAEPAARPDNALFEYEVEKPVSQAPNSAVPAYPDILRQAGVEGSAIVSLAILAMMATPVVTVITIAAGFFRINDRRFGQVSLVVLGVLCISIIAALLR